MPLIQGIGRESHFLYVEAICYFPSGNTNTSTSPMIFQSFICVLCPPLLPLCSYLYQYDSMSKNCVPSMYCLIPGMCESFSFSCKQSPFKTQYWYFSLDKSCSVLINVQLILHYFLSTGRREHWGLFIHRILSSHTLGCWQKYMFASRTIPFITSSLGCVWRFIVLPGTWAFQCLAFCSVLSPVDVS